MGGGIRLFLGLLMLAGLAAVPASHFWVRSAAGPRCHDALEAVPALPVAVVMGCSPLVQGRPNLFFQNRMAAAARLYHAGKVRALIVSGDNGSKEYDEPTAMKAALEKLGVPAAAVHCDYAGFRTLDSVVRARSVFGQERFLIVSQRFHNERAVFIARRRGLDVHAYNAEDVPGGLGMKTHLREYLARVQAVLDVTLLQATPKYDGPREPVTDAAGIVL